MPEPDTTSPLLTVDHATKIYSTSTGPLTAIEDLSLTVDRGEFVSILGPSGSGKSTLLWAISGLHPLTSGTVTLDGNPVTKPPRELGMVFQDANLLPWRNLWENILFPFEIRHQDSRPYHDRIRELLRLTGLAGFEQKMPLELSGGMRQRASIVRCLGFEIRHQDSRPYHDRIRELLRLTGLAGFEQKMPLELSGGMRQRASIVRCLGFDPDVILMDEPFGALDAFTRDEMNLLIQQVWMDTQKTIVFVTHNITEAVFLADRVVVLSPRPGRIAHIFPVDLPRPRTIDQTLEPPFIALVQQIKATIERGTGPKATATEATA